MTGQLERLAGMKPAAGGRITDRKRNALDMKNRNRKQIWRLMLLACALLAAGILAGCQSSGGSGSAESQKQENASVDIDLTQMSSTMIYSEVYNMVNEPDDYLGKTIKMEGTCSVYHDDATGNDYYACIIQDATACCAQGIEFDLAAEYKYPGDYISEGETVTVAGVFSSYEEGEEVYYTLRNAKLFYRVLS